MLGRSCTRIVTASEDKTARLWDGQTGKPIGEPLRGHGDRVVSAAFSPDGRRIVTASWDKTARLWDGQ
jgi:WD40 repeat protein